MNREKNKNIELTIKNYINNIILTPGYIKRQKYTGKEKYKKEFTIQYNEHKYIFERFHDDDNILILHSYLDDSQECVSLTLEKKRKVFF